MRKRMFRLFIAAFLISQGICNQSMAQYYYKDILTSRQFDADIALYKSHKIHAIEVNSYEADDQLTKGFFCEKKISKDFRKIETYTRSEVNPKSILTAYLNDKGYIIKSVDSSELVVSYTEYQYYETGDIKSISTVSRSHDDDFVTRLSEIHQYQFNDRHQPKKMWVIKNGKDTTEIDFKLDSSGNVSEEIEVAVYGKHYYYYYDNQNRLTDIVRYNVVKGKPLPDYIFEYNDAGQLSKMIATDISIKSDYLIWSYIYDGELKIKDKCYSKQKTLLGYFEYEYQ